MVAANKEVVTVPGPYATEGISLVLAAALDIAAHRRQVHVPRGCLGGNPAPYCYRSRTCVMAPVHAPRM